MHIDRRALLIGAAAVVGGVAVGTVAERLDLWDPRILGGTDPDGAIIRVFRNREAVLIRAYDAALAGTPDPAAALGGRLQAFRQHHVDHLVALGGGPGDIQDAPAPGQADPAGSGSAAPMVPALPADPGSWPAYFAEQEQQHADATGTGVRISTDGDLARLLALIMASETAHAAGWGNG